MRIGKYYSLSRRCLPQAHLLKETSGCGAQLEVVRQIFPEVPYFDFISCLPLGDLLCSTIHNDVQLYLGAHSNEASQAQMETSETVSQDE